MAKLKCRTSYQVAMGDLGLARCPSPQWRGGLFPILNAVDCASQSTHEIGESSPHEPSCSHHRLPPRVPGRPPRACDHDRQEGFGRHRGVGVPAAYGLRTRRRMAGRLHDRDRRLAGGRGGTAGEGRRAALRQRMAGHAHGRPAHTRRAGRDGHMLRHQRANRRVVEGPPRGDHHDDRGLRGQAVPDVGQLPPAARRRVGDRSAHGNAPQAGTGVRRKR